MAARRKKTARVRFELARSAIAGIAVVVFCLFLWTFIFGVWAGQSMLAPQGERERTGKKSVVINKKITIVPEEISARGQPPLIRAVKKKREP